MDEDREMTAHEAEFYKKNMKKMRNALSRGDEAEATRIANKIQDFFNV